MPLETVPHGGQHQFDTFEGHSFTVRHLNHVPGSETSFTIQSDNEHVVVVVADRSSKLSVQRTPRPASTEDSILQCSEENEGGFARCVAKTIGKVEGRMERSQQRMIARNALVADRLRNYTCPDPTMRTSSPISLYGFNWPSTEPRFRYNVSVLFQSSHAMIWAVDDFVTDDECNLLEAKQMPTMEHATVMGDDGPMRSATRTAMHSGYDSHLRDLQADPLWDLQQRILSLTNQHAGYNLTYAGQEGFTAIHYSKGTEYRPHCDSTCDGSVHLPGGRIATAVMYCREPEAGGGTSFSRANVFVKPKRLTAAFFAYMGADRRMDSGFTEHSGCPVLRGEKFITVFWMREGVTLDCPAKTFDPSGNLMPSTDGATEGVPDDTPPSKPFYNA